MGDFLAKSGKSCVKASLSANALALEEEQAARSRQEETGWRHDSIEVYDAPRSGGRSSRDALQPGQLSAAELQQIASDQAELASMITEFAATLADQQEGLDCMDAATAESVDNMVAGLEQLVEAQHLDGWSKYKLRAVAFGLIAGGVTGGLAVSGVGLVAAIGAVAGGVVASAGGSGANAIVKKAIHAEIDAISHEMTRGKQKPREEWTPDNDTQQCQWPKCRQAFSFTVRRHHCRICGGVFCWQCAPKIGGIRTCFQCTGGQRTGASHSTSKSQRRPQPASQSKQQLTATSISEPRKQPPSNHDNRCVAAHNALQMTYAASDAATAAAAMLSDQGEQISHTEGNAELAALAASRAKRVEDCFSGEGGSSVVGALRTLFFKGPASKKSNNPSTVESQQEDDLSPILHIGGDNRLQDELASATRQNLRTVKAMQSALEVQQSQLDRVEADVDEANAKVDQLSTMQYGEVHHRSRSSKVYRGAKFRSV